MPPYGTTSLKCHYFKGEYRNFGGLLDFIFFLEVVNAIDIMEADTASKTSTNLPVWRFEVVRKWGSQTLDQFVFDLQGGGLGFFICERMISVDSVSTRHVQSAYLLDVEYFWQSLKKKTTQLLYNLKWLLTAQWFFFLRQGGGTWTFAHHISHSNLSCFSPSVQLRNTILLSFSWLEKNSTFWCVINLNSL